MSDTAFFVYKLVPPRPTFFADQTEEEAGIMARHIEYWTGKLAEGTAVVFGPVLEDDQVWGLGVIEVSGEHEAMEIREGDPVVSTGLGSVEIFPMPMAIARPTPDPRT